MLIHCTDLNQALSLFRIFVKLFGKSVQHEAAEKMLTDLSEIDPLDMLEPEEEKFDDHSEIFIDELNLSNTERSRSKFFHYFSDEYEKIISTTERFGEKKIHCIAPSL